MRSGQVTHGDRAEWAHSDNYDSSRGWLSCYHLTLHVFRISASLTPGLIYGLLTAVISSLLEVAQFVAIHGMAELKIIVLMTIIN